MTDGPQRFLITIGAYAYLEAEFLEALDCERAVLEKRQFPDGERYLRILEDLRGSEVVLLAGTPTDLDCLELYDLGFAISRAGARSLSIVMPYFGYATMERAVLPGEVVTAKTRARLISSIPACEGGTRVLLFDLHTDGVEFYFADNHLTRHLYGAPLITRAVRNLMQGRAYVLGATDAGRAKWVQSLAKGLGVEPAFVYKQRDPNTGALSVTGVNADVSGREVVIYDDMIRTGSSLLQAGRAYLSAGATAVHAIASHLVLPADSLARLTASGVFSSIHGTNSHPGSQQLAPSALTSVAELFAQAL